MGSKKHRKRDDSSSSEYSDSSADSGKKHSKTHHHSGEKEGISKKARKTERKHESGRTRRGNSEEKSSSTHKRSRSRSNNRTTTHRDRSRSTHRSPSRDSRRETDRDRKSHSTRFDEGENSRGFNDSRYNRNGRRQEDFRRNDSANRRRKSRSPYFDHSNAKWGKNDDHSKDNEKEGENKAKPNFGLSGKLTEQTNTYRGVVIKYSEPPEARKPRRRWRLYPFKGEKALQTLYIHRESAYLIGRDRKVVDLAVDHPSCSKQHAALQYRLVPFTRENGSDGKRVRPYLIDLESANGTYINNKKIEAKKYVELLERDVIKFGFSSREYVLLHENSKDEAMDDDVKLEDEIKEELDIKEEGD